MKTLQRRERNERNKGYSLDEEPCVISTFNEKTSKQQQVDIRPVSNTGKWLTFM